LAINFRNVPVQRADNEYDQEELRTSDDAESDKCSYDRKAIHCATTEVIGKIAINTFEIFPKAVKKSSTGNGVMEPDICKQDGFQQLFIQHGGRVD
jgi:hypothetical protein